MLEWPKSATTSRSSSCEIEGLNLEVGLAVRVSVVRAKRVEDLELEGRFSCWTAVAIAPVRQDVRSWSAANRVRNDYRSSSFRGRAPAFRSWLRDIYGITELLAGRRKAKGIARVGSRGRMILSDQRSAASVASHLSGGLAFLGPAGT